MDFKIVKTAAEVEEAFRHLEKSEIIELDIETTSLEPRNGEIRLIQLGDGGDDSSKEIYVFDMYELENLDCFVGKLRFLMESPKHKKVVHNAKFESGWFIAKFNIYITPLFCTYLGSRLIDHDEAHNLAAVAERYIGIPINKDEQLSDWSKRELSRQQLEYAANDVRYLARIRAAILSRLVQADMIETAAIEFGAIHAISKLEITGYPVDVKMYGELVEYLRKDRDTKSQALQKILRATRPQTEIQTSLFEEVAEKDYYAVNLNSPIQVTTAFKKLGVPILSNAKDAALIQKYLKEKIPFITSTGYDDLVTIVDDYPVLRPLVDYRKAQKLFGSYGEPVYNMIDNGRIYANYWQIGAETGRMSCSDPNLQQVPKDKIFRRCFRAPEGYKLIIADYSGFELRILADYCQDPLLLKVFRDGLDMHSMTAASVFGIPYEDIDGDRKKYKTQRDLAKTLNFGIVYGMGYQTYAKRTGVSEKEAEEFITRLKQTYPIMDKWLFEQGKKGLKSLSARTKSNRLVQFKDPGDHKGQQGAVRRNARNTPIQGTNADIIKIAAREVERKLREENLDAYIVNIVHDELNVIASDGDAPRVRAIVQTTMEEVAQPYVPSVPIIAEAEICNSWADK